MYETRAYDKVNDDGFGADPVVVMVVTGTHDVSRLINLLHRGQPVVEQLMLGDKILKQVKRHSGGRAALDLLRRHGGPDFTDEIAGDREALGRMVRDVWIGWAREQPNPKPSWLLPWDDLDEPDREVDRRIGETLASAGRHHWVAAGADCSGSRDGRPVSM